MSRLRSALLTATLLSLLAHWMVLDALREPAGEGSGARPAIGTTTEPILAHIVSAAEKLDEGVAPEGRSALPAAARPATPARRNAPQAGAQTRNLESVPAPSVPTDMPMESPADTARNPAEGLIAYRLALAASGGALEVPAGDAVGLRLSVDAEGKAGDASVLRSSGDPVRDAFVMRWVQRAAARAEVPGVLRGHSFAVELVVE